MSYSGATAYLLLSHRMGLFIYEILIRVLGPQKMCQKLKNCFCEYITNDIRAAVIFVLFSLLIFYFCGFFVVDLDWRTNGVGDFDL